MRISDWSSDVCSSDLCTASARLRIASGPLDSAPERTCGCAPVPPLATSASSSSAALRVGALGWGDWLNARSRSEEHTSELQSLMRISYAVFCLKKKNKIDRQHVCSPVTNEQIVYHLQI